MAARSESRLSLDGVASALISEVVSGLVSGMGRGRSAETHSLASDGVGGGSVFPVVLLSRAATHSVPPRAPMSGLQRRSIRETLINKGSAAWHHVCLYPGHEKLRWLVDTAPRCTGPRLYGFRPLRGFDAKGWRHGWPTGSGSRRRRLRERSLSLRIFVL